MNESINAWRHLGMRPLCPCCGGGEHRKGYAHTKAASRAKSQKAKRDSHKIDKRARRAARPEKF